MELYRRLEMAIDYVKQVHDETTIPQPKITAWENLIEECAHVLKSSGWCVFHPVSGITFTEIEIGADPDHPHYRPPWHDAPGYEGMI